MYFPFVKFILSIFIFIFFFKRLNVSDKEIECVEGGCDETLMWTWDGFRRKRLSRQHWYDTYGHLLPMIRVERDDFKVLCGRAGQWTEVEDVVRRAVAGSLLGRKLFSGLTQFVTGAKVGNVVLAQVAEWQNAAALVTRQVFDAAAVKLAEQAICLKDLTEN